MAVAARKLRMIAWAFASIKSIDELQFEETLLHDAALLLLLELLLLPELLLVLELLPLLEELLGGGVTDRVRGCGATGRLGNVI